MYRKILVTLENSRTDEAILAHIEPLARLMGSELVLVHVADGWVARNLNQLNLAESREMRDDRAYLERVRSRFVDSGIPAQAVLLVGEPADAIVRLARENGADLIAMSTHGHRFLGDLIYGSTASRVRHTVQIPVLLLRA
ncbi:MAG: universal stress protein [Proteobacteria bacterium]|nr:universal stress protein [Pseudomonadota bacterium]